MQIKYYSTNHNLSDGFKEKVSFKEALFKGLAPDRGLFMPESIPSMTKEEILALKDKPYYEVAYAVLKKFIDLPELKELCKDAYYFEVPIEKTDDFYLMRLDKGPTASFKDFAARFMARMIHCLKPRDKKITILVATSGDTGSAVGEAFRGLDMTDTETVA